MVGTWGACSHVKADWHRHRGGDKTVSIGAELIVHLDNGFLRPRYSRTQPHRYAESSRPLILLVGHLKSGVKNRPVGGLHRLSYKSERASGRHRDSRSHRPSLRLGKRVEMIAGVYFGGQHDLGALTGPYIRRNKGRLKGDMRRPPKLPEGRHDNAHQKPNKG